jgi:sulfonate transport system permease protein
MMSTVLNWIRHPLAKGLVLPLLLLAAWESVSRQGGAHAYAFVPLAHIWRGLLEVLSSGELQGSLLATLRTMLTGLIVGGSAGLAIGGLMAVSRVVNVIVGPLYHALRQVPMLGLVPLFGLWFGTGDTAKYIIVSLAAFYPMVLNTYEGIRQVERKLIEVGTVYRLSSWQMTRRVLLPGALPSIWTGLMHALAFAWISTVGSELLFVSGAGLGTLMQNAQANSRLDIVIIGVASIGVTGLLLNQLFTRLRYHTLKGRIAR